jgi:hypothetical protein
MRTLARIALALAALAGGPAFAHPLAPSLVELRAGPPGEGQLLLRTPLLRAPGGELGVDLREGCRLLGAEPTVRESNARVERWRIDCEDGDPVGALLAVEGLDASRTQAHCSTQSTRSCASRRQRRARRSLPTTSPSASSI